MIFYIYKITNVITNKIYIGKTNNLRLRFNTHRSKAFSSQKKDRNALPKLYNSIRKYGIENFLFEPIAYFEKENDCYIIESLLIDKLDTIKNGYNISKGGLGQTTGFKHTKESLEKIRNSHLGEKNHFYGKIHTKESLIKMSNSHKRTAPKGENNKSSKLTSIQVIEIRRLFQSKEKGPKQISKEMHIPISTIKDIIYNKTWRHLL